MTTVIVDHDLFVEAVVFELSVLPSFLLAAQVVREQAYEIVHGRCGWRAVVAGWRRGLGLPYSVRHLVLRFISEFCEWFAGSQFFVNYRDLFVVRGLTRLLRRVNGSRPTPVHVMHPTLYDHGQ